MSAEKKTLAIFGATGHQGGAIAKHYLASPSSPYSIRALTRNTSSPAALALASLGASTTYVDLDDAASLAPAVADASAVFLVTDFWNNLSSPTAELDQGKRAVDAIAQLPNLEHFIWSSLPSITDASNGKYTKVAHFDGKEEVRRYIESKYPGLWAKTTVLWVAGYFQLWKQNPGIFAPQKTIADGGDEVWVQSSLWDPKTRMPQVDVGEVSKVVAQILARGPFALGKKIVTAVSPSSDSDSLGDTLNLWGQVLGKKVEYRKLEEEDIMQELKGMKMPDWVVDDIYDVLRAWGELGESLLKGDGLVSGAELLPQGEKLRSWVEYVRTEDWEEFLKGQPPA